MDQTLFLCGPFSMLFVAVVLRIASLAQPETTWSGYRRKVLIMISYLSIAIALVGMVFLLVTQGPVGLAGLVLAVSLAISITEAEIRLAGVRNRARQAELLWVLAIAVKSGRPLAAEIDAYAAGTFGKRHQLLSEMAERLQDGVSLTELVVPHGLLPASATMQIHSGITSRSLEESLSSTANRITRELSEEQETEFPGAGLAYPPSLMVLASLVVAFMCYYIVPKFKKIFDDFGTELPNETIVFIRSADALVNYWFTVGLPVLVYAPVGICVFVGMAEYYGWQVLLQSLLGRWFIRWYTPDVLRALSQSVAQDIPIDRAIEPIIQFAGPLRLRKKLALVREEIEEGVACWTAMEKVGLLKTREAVVLESAQRIGNLPWALKTIATSIERRRSNRIKAFLEILQPVMLVPIGIMVGMIAIAMFLPLVKLLNDLS